MKIPNQPFAGNASLGPQLFISLALFVILTDGSKMVIFEVLRTPEIQNTRLTPSGLFDNKHKQFIWDFSSFCYESEMYLWGLLGLKILGAYLQIMLVPLFLDVF